jgi:hypothetical protein
MQRLSQQNCWSTEQKIVLSRELCYNCHCRVMEVLMPCWCACIITGHSKEEPLRHNNPTETCATMTVLQSSQQKTNSWSLFSDLSWRYPSLAIFFCSSEIEVCPSWDKSSLGPVRTISLWPANRIGIQLEFPSPACSPCYTCILLRLLCLFRTTIIQ